VDLKPPDDLFRAVTIDGEMLTLDDEWTPNAKQILANPHSYKSLFAVLRIGPFDTHDETTFSDVVDGDVRSEFHIEADWHLDKSVREAFCGRTLQPPSTRRRRSGSNGRRATDPKWTCIIHWLLLRWGYPESGVQRRE